MCASACEQVLARLAHLKLSVLVERILRVTVRLVVLTRQTRRRLVNVSRLPVVGGGGGGGAAGGMVSLKELEDYMQVLVGAWLEQCRGVEERRFVKRVVFFFWCVVVFIVFEALSMFCRIVNGIKR